MGRETGEISCRTYQPVKNGWPAGAALAIRPDSRIPVRIYPVRRKETEEPGNRWAQMEERILDEERPIFDGYRYGDIEVPDLMSGGVVSQTWVTPAENANSDNLIRHAHLEIRGEVNLWSRSNFQRLMRKIRNISHFNPLMEKGILNHLLGWKPSVLVADEGISVSCLGVSDRPLANFYPLSVSLIGGNVLSRGWDAYVNYDGLDVNVAWNESSGLITVGPPPLMVKSVNPDLDLSVYAGAAVEFDDRVLFEGVGAVVDKLKSRQLSHEQIAGWFKPRLVIDYEDNTA